MLKSSGTILIAAMLWTGGLASVHAEDKTHLDLQLGTDQQRHAWNCGSDDNFHGFLSDLQPYQGRELSTAVDRARCRDLAYKVFGTVDYNGNLLMVGGEAGYWSESRNDSKNARATGDAMSGNDDRPSAATDTFYYGLRLGLNLQRGHLVPYVVGGLHSRQWNALWNSNGGIFSHDVSDTVDPYYGLGVKYDFWQFRDRSYFSLRGKWERFDFDDADPIDFYGMSVLYWFDL